jgi:hypothetical protein
MAQFERKARSESRLREEGVELPGWMSVIEDESEAKPRQPQEVAERLIALVIVALKADALLDVSDRKAAHEYTRGVIERKGAARFFTPDESQFVAPRCSGDVWRFLRRYESAWVLFWALNWLEGPLPHPSTLYDVRLLVDTVLEQPNLAERGLRPLAELLDEADLIYRYRCIAREALLRRERSPVDASYESLLERHQALNWLIGHKGQPWDKVPTEAWPEPASAE